MILCEQCGNEFNRGRIVVRDEKEYIECPYCRYPNKKTYYKKKKRGARQ